MTTAAQLADVVAGAMEGANAVVAARWEGPADQLATPAVVVSPSDPWLAIPRLGGRVFWSWTVAVVAGRWDAPTSLMLAASAYQAAAPLITALDDYAGLEPLGAPYPETIGGVPVLVARFSVTLSPDPGGP